MVGSATFQNLREKGNIKQKQVACFGRHKIDSGALRVDRTLDALLAIHRRSAREPPVPIAQQEPQLPEKCMTNHDGNTSAGSNTLIHDVNRTLRPLL